MTNKERISSNNALIDEAIAKANELPDAGGGGGGSEVGTICTIRNNLSANVFIGSLVVLAGESVELPTPSHSLLLFITSDTDTSIDVLINGTSKKSLLLYNTSAWNRASSGTMNLAAIYTPWILISAINAGDIIDIGTPN